MELRQELHPTPGSICWFYSQGICYDARSHDRKKSMKNDFKEMVHDPNSSNSD
jgi:hypothetical protein